jgi:hypothetical protein
MPMSILVEEILTRLDQLTPEELRELEQSLEQRATPGAENLRLMRVTELTKGQQFALRLGKLTRKTLVWSSMLGVLLIVFVAMLYFWRTETISEGSRQDQFQAGISYRIERHRYRDIATVVFDDGVDGVINCTLSPMQFEQLVEQRWLANGRAIFLHLRLKSPEALGEDGKPDTKSAKLLYDYHRGELYVTSPLHLWRTASSESHWMNEEEFTGLLNRFAQ